MMTIFMIIYIGSVLAALGLGALAGWSDIRRMTIPNYIVVMVLVTFLTGYMAAWWGGAGIFSSFKAHLLAGGIGLIVTFIMFCLKIIGGGDSKLAAAFAVWMGSGGLSAYLFFMALSGALFAALTLVLKKRKPVKKPFPGSWIARAQAGENVVPYGVPIALGAVAGFIESGLMMPDNLSLFLMSK